MILLAGGSLVIGLSLGMTVEMPFPKVAPLCLYGCISVLVALMSAIDERIGERMDVLAP